MVERSWFTLAAVLMAMGLGIVGGCSSSGGTEGSADADEPEKVFMIKEGMTMAEVVDMYEGEPDTKTKNSDGTETWRYHTNAGEAFIPFNYGYRPEYHHVTFSADGKVTSYSMDD